jgi:hypothetical protein
MLGQTLVLMQITFLNNVRKVGSLVLSRTSCLFTHQPRTQLHVMAVLLYPKHFKIFENVTYYCRSMRQKDESEKWR